MPVVLKGYSWLCLEIILFRDHLEVLEELVSWGAFKAGTLSIVLSCCALLPMAISQKYCIMQLILFPSFRCISVVMSKGYHLLLCQGCATVGCSSHWEAGWGSRNYRGSAGDHSDSRCYIWNPGSYACKAYVYHWVMSHIPHKTLKSSIVLKTTG